MDLELKSYCPMARPNTAFQPTPLRCPKSGGILKRGFVLTLVPIYTAARLNASRWARSIKLCVK
jgi:hypothetical protein